jgi:hypothetical protein
VLLV